MNGPIRILGIMTTASVRWRITITSPELFEAKLCGYPLLNPIFNHLLVEESSVANYARISQIFLPSKDEVVFSSGTIHLMIPSDINVDVFSDDNFAKIEAQVLAFLMWIRFLSFQHEMPSSPTTLGRVWIEDEPLATPVFPDLSGAHKAFGHAYLVECCATEHMAAEAARRVAVQDTVPVYHYLLVDAFAAFEAYDYRQCLLYAAIAVEALAASCLDREYSARLSGNTGPNMRIIELPQAGGAMVRKDPVYEALSARTEFSALLHERPLYLLGKSLLTEHPEIYRRALMLYSTRNKIVHRGELSGEDAARCFSLSRGDAQIALGCAADIFRWFGESPIKYPNDRPIHLREARWGPQQG